VLMRNGADYWIPAFAGMTAGMTTEGWATAGNSIAPLI
jgi:hypothetical protein